MIKQLKIFNAFKTEMKTFEKAFDNYIEDLEFASYLKDAKGKMLRPALTILAGSLGSEIKEASIWAAISVELMHNATLIHDDVVDDADLRRDKDTFRAKQGDKRAVLYGDYLLAKSLECVAKTGDTKIVKTIAQATADMSIGEIDQLKASGVYSTVEEEYFDIIYKKTASLFICSLMVGYQSACTDCQLEPIIKEIGYNLGMAFQIGDDLLDYDSTADSGKPLGNDIIEQKMTLPLIYALNQVDNSTKEEIIESVTLAPESDDAIDKVINFVEEKGGIDYTKQTLHDFLTKANNAINQLPNGNSKEALKLLSQYFAKRER